MKKLAITLALCLASTASIAAHHGEKAGKEPMDFDARKAKMLEKMDRHLARMTEIRQCVAQAADPEAMKECKPARKATHEGHENHGKAEKQ